jgi:uncharacterized protein (TIGR03084 family)
VLTQAADFREECDQLFELLNTAPDDAWETPTQFKRWTPNDVLGHLHLFDVGAKLTVEGPDAFPAFAAKIAAGRAQGLSLAQYTRQWLGDGLGLKLLLRWRDSYLQVAERYADLDPAMRVKWAGPDMSVRSCISARQMETWAHGQAVFDLLGRERVEHDRIRNIAIMGVNTFGWTFVSRGLPVPEIKPHVRLVSPSGAIWQWNAQDERNRIEGSAVEFCRVVTQTRNVADTSLQVTGDAARAWMSMAQCFAGPPESPPAPGTRFRQ